MGVKNLGHRGLARESNQTCLRSQQVSNGTRQGHCHIRIIQTEQACSPSGLRDVTDPIAGESWDDVLPKDTQKRKNGAES